MLATVLHARSGIELATAALWPVAAMAWGPSALADSPAYARAGFRSLAWSQRHRGDHAAAESTLAMLRSLGPAFEREAEEEGATISGGAAVVSARGDVDRVEEGGSSSHALGPAADGGGNADGEPPPSGVIVYLCCADDAEVCTRLACNARAFMALCSRAALF